eukprot:augustus_masked-scaffold_27-processed-gene-2.12-mRNA-1 protein AED:1.00 eAED:1.00 QI:0/-1/0/0/-1/1/1/0/383
MYNQIHITLRSSGYSDEKSRYWYPKLIAKVSKFDYPFLIYKYLPKNLQTNLALPSLARNWKSKGMLFAIEEPTSETFWYKSVVKFFLRFLLNQDLFPENNRSLGVTVEDELQKEGILVVKELIPKFVNKKISYLKINERVLVPGGFILCVFGLSTNLLDSDFDNISFECWKPFSSEFAFVQENKKPENPYLKETYDEFCLREMMKTGRAKVRMLQTRLSVGEVKLVKIRVKTKKNIPRVQSEKDGFIQSSGVTKSVKSFFGIDVEEGTVTGYGSFEITQKDEVHMHYLLCAAIAQSQIKVLNRKLLEVERNYLENKQVGRTETMSWYGKKRGDLEAEIKKWNVQLDKVFLKKGKLNFDETAVEKTEEVLKRVKEVTTFISDNT